MYLGSEGVTCTVFQCFFSHGHQHFQYLFPFVVRQP